MEFTFAVMDQEKGRALIIGNNGAANVSFNRGSNTTTFFEHTPAGNWNVTVIIDEVKGVTRAITSRHIVDPTGLCHHLAVDGHLCDEILNSGDAGDGLLGWEAERSFR